jgi:hypothetical protein
MPQGTWLRTTRIRTQLLSMVVEIKSVFRGGEKCLMDLDEEEASGEEEAEVLVSVVPPHPGPTSA